MSESTYTIKGTLVKGKGYSYNLNNKHDANHLCERLNNYEKTIQQNNNLDLVLKQLTQIQMSVKILEHEINKVQETLNACPDRHPWKQKDKRGPNLLRVTGPWNRSQKIRLRRLCLRWKGSIRVQDNTWLRRINTGQPSIQRSHKPSWKL